MNRHLALEDSSGRHLGRRSRVPLSDIDAFDQNLSFVRHYAQHLPAFPAGISADHQYHIILMNVHYKNLSMYGEIKFVHPTVLRVLMILFS